MQVRGAMLAAITLAVSCHPGAVPGGAPAQTTTGTISGVVQDPSGAVLPGVAVTITSTATGLARAAVSGDGGRYVVPALPPGAYELRAELAGFAPHVRRGLNLAVNETLALNLTLQIGTLAVEDVVVGTSPLVNTSTSELSYLVGQEAIERLPLNGRNYTDLALLQPGVIAYPHRDGGSVVAHGMGVSVNGQDPRSNVYLLDGTLQNDFTNGPAGSAAGTALGMDSVREFRVEANAYSAEFGRNSGGQINVLTKSGTNRIDASLFEYHRNDALDARNYFDTGPKPDFHRNQFGGTIGGPIRQNRTFFFLNYEALIERLGRTISTFVPDDNARLGILPDGPSASTPRWRLSSPSSRAPTARCSARGWPSTISRSRRRWISTSCRAGSTSTPAPTGRCSRATRSTTPTSSCRPTTRSSRASSCRATSSSPASTARCSRRAR